MTKQVQQLDHDIIRLAGDPGDGIQPSEDTFAQETAIFGNDLSTLPNIPAEIQAPPKPRGGACLPARLGELSSASGPGLLTWSEIWCDVENSKSFRSSRHCRVSPGHRLKGASALHNSLASIFTAPGVTTWSDMSGNARKNQVTRLVTLRHRSTMSGARVS